MAKQYSFYPGCSSQKKASSYNQWRSTQTICQELDIQSNEIPDWNCCSASIGYAGGSELPRLVRSARNLAWLEAHLARLPVDERLKGLKSQEVFSRFTPQKRLMGLKPREVLKPCLRPEGETHA